MRGDGSPLGFCDENKIKWGFALQDAPGIYFPRVYFFLAQPVRQPTAAARKNNTNGVARIVVTVVLARDGGHQTDTDVYTLHSGHRLNISFCMGI